ncbi:MAG TPA: hypothetical protein VFP94_04920, partial [Terriglobales bacterium]|nr:hypothetical protein [Terriglobales bacterium]
MGTPYMQPPQPPPPQRTNTLLAVVIGILVVLVLMVGAGLFIAGQFLHDTSIVSRGEGADKTVDIHSPLGDLHVKGEGNDAKVDINSPFGSLHVDPTPELSRLDMGMYPGAIPVSKEDRDSPFFHSDHDRTGATDNLDANDLNSLALEHSSGAEVRLSSGGKALLITVAEFRTADSPDKVLDLYRRQLGRFGTVVNDDTARGRGLKVKLSE